MVQPVCNTEYLAQLVCNNDFKNVTEVLQYRIYGTSGLRGIESSHHITQYNLFPYIKYHLPRRQKVAMIDRVRINFYPLEVVGRYNDPRLQLGTKFKAQGRRAVWTQNIKCTSSRIIIIMLI